MVLCEAGSECVCACAALHHTQRAVERGTFCVICCLNYKLFIHKRPFVFSYPSHDEPLLDSKDNTVTEHIYVCIYTTIAWRCRAPHSHYRSVVGYYHIHYPHV